MGSPYIIFGQDRFRDLGEERRVFAVFLTVEVRFEVAGLVIVRLGLDSASVGTGFFAARCVDLALTAFLCAERGELDFASNGLLIAFAGVGTLSSGTRVQVVGSHVMPSGMYASSSHGSHQ